MKRITALLCLAAFCFASAFLVAFAMKENTESESITTDLTEVVKAVKRTATTKKREPDAIIFVEPAKGYNTEEEKLADKTVSAFAGTVIKTRTIEFKSDNRESFYTCSTVKINKIFKGNFESDEIEVIEPGGIKTSSSKFISYSGYIPATAGDEVIFCVCKCNPNESSLKDYVNLEKAYRVAGVVEGKLTFKNGKYVSDTPKRLLSGNSKTSFTLEEYEKMAEKVRKSTVSSK